MSETVATVNGSPISAFDLENTVQGLSMELYRKTMDQLSADELRELEEMALEKLIARELIYQNALAHGVVADAAAVAEEMNKVVANFPSEEEFRLTIAKAQIDVAGYQRMLRHDLTVNLMTERVIGDLAPPSAEEVAATYRRFPEKMTTSERVRAAHILVRIVDGRREEAEERIEALQERLAGSDFSDLAREHSDCPSASSGGDLGYFRRGDMVKNFEEAAFALAPGEVSGVVETQFGLHLIKVLDREAPVPLSLAEATPKIEALLREEARARRLEEWVAELRSSAVVTRNR